MMEPDWIMYGYSSLTIVITLFVTMILLNEISFRVGVLVQKESDTEVKSLTGSIQASILGLLALLLGFTFSMSMQRYDHRNMALIDEVNVISTSALHADALPEPYREKVLTLLQEYVEVRVEVGQVDLTQFKVRNILQQDIDKLQSQLWQLAVEVSELKPASFATKAFIGSVNAMIEKQSRRNALLQMQVPEVVLMLLFLVFISAGVIMGYSAGLSGRRVLAPIVLVSLLITLIVFIVIDLDRPKRGMIQVNQYLMTEQLQNIKEQLQK